MERDPETGKTLLRGDVVMSHNLVGIDTAAAEMKGVESLVASWRLAGGC
jgi:hypothetical protein